MRSLILLTSLMLCANAWSQALSTNELMAICEEPELELSCSSYHSAAVSTAWLMAGIDEAPPYYCIPDNFNTGIGIEIWRRYVEENPEKLTDPAVGSILLSLIQAYPCTD